MEKIYSFELTPKGMKDAQKLLEKIEKFWLSEEFKQKLGKILRKQLIKIQKEKLTTIHTNEDIQYSKYMTSNHVEIQDDTIYIYNDAMIDIADKNMKETTKANYPAQLSLAKIVEYGIGYTGGMNANGEEEDWAYDVNQHGSAGWYYRDNSGEVHWTNGFAGRYIFLELKKYLEENIQQIMEEFIEEWFKEI